MKTASIKDLRQNLAEFADAAEKGEIITVFRRSKASFKIVPVDINTEQWETVVDFTENGTKDGEDIADVIAALEDMDK